QSVSSVRDLLVFMDEALSFLEAKFDAGIVFVHDMRAAAQQREDTSLRHGAAPPEVLAALEAAYARGVPLLTLQRGDELGLPPNTALMLFSLPAEAEMPMVRGGLYIASASALSATTSADFTGDARIFLENWVIAHSALRLQQQVA